MFHQYCERKVPNYEILIISEHGKGPESSPEGGNSPTGTESPNLPTNDNREEKSDNYIPNNNIGPMMNPPMHEMPHNTCYDEGRAIPQNFPFPPLLLAPQIDNTDNIPTDLRILAPKNSTGCPCNTQTQNNEEPQNLAYRPPFINPKNASDSDNDSDAEIDLTSHSSRDDDLRESERLANRIANSIFRSDTVLQDMVPNDLSLNSVKNVSRANTVPM